MPDYSRTTVEEKKEIISSFLRGENPKVIAARIGLSFTSVYRLLKRSGIACSPVRKHQLNEDAFVDAAGSEAAAYWVGFLMADGCVHTKSGRPRVVSLRLSSRDKEHVEEFKQFLGSSHKIVTVPASETVCKGEPIKSGECVYVSIPSARLAESLEKYGVKPRKSLTAEVHELQNNRHFWRGVICGDGHVGVHGKSGKKKSPVVHLIGSEKLISQFSYFVHGFTETEALPRRMQDYWQFAVQGKPAVQVSHKLFDDCSVVLRRKAESAKVIFVEHEWRLSQESQKNYMHLTTEELTRLRSEFGSWAAVCRSLDMKHETMIAVRRRLGMLELPPCLRKH